MPESGALPVGASIRPEETVVLHRPSSGRVGEQGAMAVEFILVLPIFVLLVFGIIEFGRGYNAKIELTGAVREGARSLALGQTAADAEAAVTGAAPSLDPAQISFSETTTCPNDDDRATITAEYPVAFNIPFLSEGVWDLSITGVMRCGV